MISPDKNQRLYTADEAAALLRVKPRKVIEMGHAGEIEMIRLGPRILRFTARSLQKWLKPSRSARHAE